MAIARKFPTCWRGALAAFALLWPVAAAAQTDEIQVYDASIAPVGVFNLTLHNNYIAERIEDARISRCARRQPHLERRARMGLWRHALVRSRPLYAALQRLQQPGRR